MNKIERSGKLFKMVFTVLFGEKKLMLFPLITLAMSMIAILFFIAPIALYPNDHPLTSAEPWRHAMHTLFAGLTPHNHADPAVTGEQKWLGAVFFAAFYFVSMFLATFSNVAFYHEIMQALSGQAVSIRRGFRVAAARWKAILLWSLFAGLVGYILNAIEQRLNFVGRAITSFIGVTWSVASIFVIPTLVRDSETISPIKLLRRSAHTLKSAWGELVIGIVRVEFPFLFIIVLVMMIPIMTGTLSPHYFWIPFLAIISFGMICNMVNRVYQCALFVYATEGVIPEPFDRELLDSAWKVK